MEDLHATIRWKGHSCVTCCHQRRCPHGFDLDEELHVRLLVLHHRRRCYSLVQWWRCSCIQDLCPTSIHRWWQPSSLDHRVPGQWIYRRTKCFLGRGHSFLGFERHGCQVCLLHGKRRHPLGKWRYSLEIGKYIRQLCLISFLNMYRAEISETNELRITLVKHTLQNKIRSCTYFNQLTRGRKMER